MDKPWIKAVLIGSFVVSLVFVFFGAYATLRQAASASLEVPELAMLPVPPPPLVLQPITDYTKPADVTARLSQMTQQVNAYGIAVKAYESNVSVYSKDLDARLAAWKAAKGDPTARLNAYEKVVKDTLGSLIVTPLLAALVLYSGIKVSGDVAAMRSLGGGAGAGRDHVRSP